MDQLDDGRLVVCGGYGDPNTCHQFKPEQPFGSWSIFAKLVEGRSRHASLAAVGKLILMGGGTKHYSNSLRTSDFVGDKAVSFNLKQKTM